MKNDQYSWVLDVGKALKSTIMAEGIFGLWRGLGSTVFRDVPFSGIYWAIYESLKAHNDVTVPTIYFSFFGGAASGSVSFVHMKIIHSHFSSWFLFVPHRLPHFWPLHSMSLKRINKSSLGRKFYMLTSRYNLYQKLEQSQFCKGYSNKMDSREYLPVLYRVWLKLRPLVPLWSHHLSMGKRFSSITMLTSTLNRMVVLVKTSAFNRSKTIFAQSPGLRYNCVQ